jgi:outer membrane protein assembly factor BamA
VRFVGRSFALVLALVACHQGSTPRAPLPIVCAEDRVGKVVIEGGTRSDVPELAVLEGTLDDPERTDRIVRVSQDLLQARGYSRAEIDVERRSGCGVELVVHVDRGPRFKLAHIAFVTDDEFPAKARYAAIEDALGTVNAIGGSFVADRLGRALEGLKDQYQDAGWLDVEIDRANAIYDEASGQVSLTIPVKAGPRYKLGNVVAKGGRRQARAAVIDALGLRGGDWYDGRAVRQAIRRARRELGEHIDVRLQVSGNAIDLEAVLGGAK